jgi:hypothetical protein
VREPLILRETGKENADVVVVVRLGTRTLDDDHLERATAEAHGRWGIWGFSVLEVPGGDYRQLVRLRPFVATRRLLYQASAADLVTAGFPVLPTLDHPHWTVELSAPTPVQFALVRGHFQGPVQNPGWTAPVR